MKIAFESPEASRVGESKYAKVSVIVDYAPGAKTSDASSGDAGMTALDALKSLHHVQPARSSLFGEFPVEKNHGI